MIKREFKFLGIRKIHQLDHKKMILVTDYDINKENIRKVKEAIKKKIKCKDYEYFLCVKPMKGNAFISSKNGEFVLDVTERKLAFEGFFKSNIEDIENKLRKIRKVTMVDVSDIKEVKDVKEINCRIKHFIPTIKRILGDSKSLIFSNFHRDRIKVFY